MTISEDYCVTGKYSDHRNSRFGQHVKVTPDQRGSRATSSHGTKQKITVARDGDDVSGHAANGSKSVSWWGQSRLLQDSKWKNIVRWHHIKNLQFPMQASLLCSSRAEKHNCPCSIFDFETFNPLTYRWRFVKPTPPRIVMACRRFLLPHSQPADDMLRPDNVYAVLACLSR